MAHSSAHLGISLLVALVLLVPHAVADDWRHGRSTHYGLDGGATINQGSCMFYNLDYWQGTGWDIVALSDTDPEYAGSCGRCYEVMCENKSFKDGYGGFVDRNYACRDPSKSIIVRVTDTCPCNYPSNAYSNKRWCCGDMPHMDLSTYAFQKLADPNLGVIGIKWRRTNCPQGTSYTTGASSSASAHASASSSGVGGGWSSSSSWSSGK